MKSSFGSEEIKRKHYQVAQYRETSIFSFDVGISKRESGISPGGGGECSGADGATGRGGAGLRRTADRGIGRSDRGV